MDKAIADTPAISGFRGENRPSAAFASIAPVPAWRNAAIGFYSIFGTIPSIIGVSIGTGMALKHRKKQFDPPADARPRKTKFQADLAPAEDRTVRLLKQELQLTSNTDFLSDALALFRWAVSERKLGHRIVSESASGERKILVFPRLERVAPDLVLPRVEIKWTERELASLAELASATEANPPTEALIRALRD